MGSDHIINEFLSLPFKKVLFSESEKYSTGDSIYIPKELQEYNEEGNPNILAMCKNGLMTFEQCFNFVKWINGQKTSDCHKL